MPTNEKELAAQLVEAARRFRFCGPSDDPDEQTAVTVSYHHLVTQLKRLAGPLLSAVDRERLNSVEIEIDNIYSAYEARAEIDSLLPEIETAIEQTVTTEISEVTRRAIFDFLATSKTDWAGRLPEDDFLARLYDLTSLRSTDHRMRNAAGDIHQHRINWRDWGDDWVFYDSRFNLLWGPDEEFLRFLCETVHPVVRPESDKARELVDAYNRELAADGWSIVEVREISGRPIFSPEKIGHRTEVFAEPTGWQKVDRQLQEVRLRLDTAESEEQFQAIGLLCREVLISVAQEVFDNAKHNPLDGVQPSATDAKRMLEAIFCTELSGGANEESRAHASAALRLALALQHKRTADFRMAALCSEATSSVVNMLAVIAGRRGRSL
jgi:hypothetical protein